VLVVNGGAEADPQRRRSDDLFRQLCAVQQMRGYKDGWAAHKFKDNFGHFPPWSYNELPPAPTDAVLSWVCPRDIAWAKSQRAA
jgi:DNA repair protein RadD